MDLNQQPKQGSISKFLVVILLIVVIAAAGVFIWMNYFRDSSSSTSTTNTQSTSSSTSTDTSSASLDETNDTTGVNEEVNALDKSMAELDDDALSDSNISDSNLGL